MTLEEAIKHTREVAREKHYDSCLKCAEEHEQLARWLEELKEVRESEKNMEEMTIEELYQMLDNVTLSTKFYIIDSSENILEWGSIYQEISHQNRSLPIVHCKYNDGEMLIWVP